ncbi:DegV family protein [Corynebacterium caspium]|uniref:DegV family protein n=1 Tax=Corynebacterium caspium TaxID=234828 RepID=UPI00036E3E83|nr:DegV family protein [Corynebacterium caspium]WKD58857.1 DegV domain-containing protein [Corynebacterium caspium DSM 44850]
MAVRIVVDSSAGLPRSLAEELEITVLNLHVLNQEEERSTSGLSSLELAAAYSRQLALGGDAGVVALHLSRELSSTWSAAHTAAAIFENNQVRIIDSGTVGMAIGAAAMAAAKLAQEGKTLDECEAMAHDTLGRSATWLYAQRVDDLRRSGRISTGTAMLSTTLATKPILTVSGGKLELAAKTRTQTKAFSRLVELILERANNEPAFVAIQAGPSSEESSDKLQKLLEESLPKGSSFMRMQLEPVLSVHAGEGSVGVSVVFSRHSSRAAN